MSVTALPYQENSLAADDLKRFSNPVRKAVLTLTREHGVRCRVLDGNHVILVGDVDTLKLSASRPGEDTLRYIAKFIETNVPELAPKPKTPTAVAGKPVVFARTGRASEYLLTDGKLIWCVACDWTREAGSLRGLHIHEAKHNGKMASYNAAQLAGKDRKKKDREVAVISKSEAAEMAELEAQIRAEDAEREQAARAEVQELTHMQAAVSALADHFGLAINHGEVEALREQLATVTHQRDELQAKLELIRESLGL